MIDAFDPFGPLDPPGLTLAAVYTVLMLCMALGALIAATV